MLLRYFTLLTDCAALAPSSETPPAFLPPLCCCTCPHGRPPDGEPRQGRGGVEKCGAVGCGAVRNALRNSAPNFRQLAGMKGSAAAHILEHFTNSTFLETEPVASSLAPSITSPHVHPPYHSPLHPATRSTPLRNRDGRLTARSPPVHHAQQKRKRTADRHPQPSTKRQTLKRRPTSSSASLPSAVPATFPYALRPLDLQCITCSESLMCSSHSS
jgi:hypothetical protein